MTQTVPAMTQCLAPFVAVGSFLVLLLSGCATTHLPPISHQGGAFRSLPDEVELWDETRAEEQEILRSVPVYRDRGLDQYLQRLVQRLAPAGLLANREIDLRVIVLDDPSPYVFTFPHGTILLHAGLLARVENRHLARHLRADGDELAARIGSLRDQLAAQPSQTVRPLQPTLLGPD